MDNCINAIAIFNQSNVKGTVKFHQCTSNFGKETYVIIDLYNLPSNTKRAIHIHEFGDTTDGCKSLGGHWNPTNKNHGSIYIDINNSHAGDMINNISPDNNGKFYFKYSDSRIQNITDILGRSVVIHDGIDDLGQTNHKDSKTTGNAGSRMACSVIGLCQKGKLEI